MGVPAFYKWLVGKYPNAVVRAVEADTDMTSLNPNGEFDNLYLDMNGIIHPCFHSDDFIHPPTTFAEVFENIYKYIDRIFSIVRPRKLLYMAIDGVAPRAKMNQQRVRRFRTAKDVENAEAEEQKLRKEFEMEGKPVLPKVESEVADSNVITPGTVFMHELSKALQSYIVERLKNYSGWRDIKVILSDANVAGEGEHKIMSFIRLQRACHDYDPNTRHCIHGLDADLLMLALATHEVHFSILRECVLNPEQQSINQSLRPCLLVADSNSSSSIGEQGVQKVDDSAYMIKRKIPYEFLNIWVLREYLELDISVCDYPENMKHIDFERIIDDFIFLCFFAGNDFLPHIPTLDIHEGAIDLLMTVYKSKFKSIGGYLVDIQRVNAKGCNYINLKRVKKFISSVAAFEDQILKKRCELLDRRMRRIISEFAATRDEELDEVDGAEAEASASRSPRDLIINHLPSIGLENFSNSPDILRKNTDLLKERLKECIKKKSNLLENGGGLGKVRLGHDGWKERYYKHKFSADSREDIESTRKSLVQSYTEGLCWVLLYYFSGVPSWTWYYPHYYGPFASDMKDLDQVKVKFQKGSPFDPFDQLMSVLPPRSAHALPKAYGALMTLETSTIVDFYPNHFEIDTDGKRFLWQGTCRLPFIEESRLLSETSNLRNELEEDEALRNAAGADQLFLRSSNDLGKEILLLKKKSGFQNQNENLKINTALSDGLSGYIDLHRKNSKQTSPACGAHLDAIQDGDVVCVCYVLPDDRQHIPRVLAGTTFPDKTITEDDILETPLWHEYRGARPPVNHPQSQRYSSHGSTASPGETSSRFMGRGRAIRSSHPPFSIGYDDYKNNWREVPISHLPGYKNNWRGDCNSTDEPSSGPLFRDSPSAWGRGRASPWSSSPEYNTHSRPMALGRNSRGPARPMNPLNDGRDGELYMTPPITPISSPNRTWRAVVYGSRPVVTGMEKLNLSDSQHPPNYLPHGSSDAWQQGPRPDLFGSHDHHGWQQDPNPIYPRAPGSNAWQQCPRPDLYGSQDRHRLQQDPNPIYPRALGSWSLQASGSNQHRHPPYHVAPGSNNAWQRVSRPAFGSQDNHGWQQGPSSVSAHQHVHGRGSGPSHPTNLNPRSSLVHGRAQLMGTTPCDTHNRYWALSEVPGTGQYARGGGPVGGQRPARGWG